MSKANAQGMFSVQDFLEAIGEQLDSAQDGLAIKARAGRPLTWALKDLSIDLQVFVEMNTSGEVTMRTAGPNEEGASTMHLSMTTITRPMVEENTWALEADTDPRPITRLEGATDLDPDQRRKLSRMGVRTVGQLKQLASNTSGGQLEAMVGIPAFNLRSMLEAAARPAVLETNTIAGDGGRHFVRVQGVNLHNGTDPEVRLAGEPVEVLSSSNNEIVVRPLEYQAEGQVEVYVGGERATGFFRLPQQPSPASSAPPPHAQGPYAQAQHSQAQHSQSQHSAAPYQAPNTPAPNTQVQAQDAAAPYQAQHARPPHSHAAYAPVPHARPPEAQAPEAQTPRRPAADDRYAFAPSSARRVAYGQGPQRDSGGGR